MKIKSKKMIGILVIFIILLGVLFVYFMNNDQNAIKERKTKTSNDQNTISNQTTDTMTIKITDNNYRYMHSGLFNGYPGSRLFLDLISRNII